jgi:hypothetical protein
VEIALRWLVGLLVALVVGHFAVEVFLQLLRRRMGLDTIQRPGRVPRRLTGFLERLVFTLFVAFQVEGAGPAMIGWLAVKLAANWDRPPPEPDPEDRRSRYAFSALVAGLFSMLFALMGGLIARGVVWPHKAGSRLQHHCNTTARHGP